MAKHIIRDINKMIRKIQSIALLKKFPAKNAIKKSLLTVELTGAALAAPFAAKYSEPAEKMILQMSDKFFSEPKIYDSELMQKHVAAINKALILKNKERILLNRQKSLIIQIMQEDKNCCKTADKNKIAENIINLSKEYGANPIHIACIVKKESHFTEHVNKGSGKGLMQLTKIAVKDMYQRPHLYHSALDNIKKEYPTHQSLFTAIQVNPELNLRVGIIAFLQRLEKSNGDVRLALQNYNGSRNKVAYANEIMKDIKKYVA